MPFVRSLYGGIQCDEPATLHHGAPAFKLRNTCRCHVPTCERPEVLVGRSHLYSAASTKDIVRIDTKFANAIDFHLFVKPNLCNAVTQPNEFSYGTARKKNAKY
jgi:hypothetical protein